jgi:hypothetical protein
MGAVVCWIWSRPWRSWLKWNFVWVRRDRITAVTSTPPLSVVRCMTIRDTGYIRRYRVQRLCSVERENFIGLCDEQERTLGTRPRPKSRYYAAKAQIKVLRWRSVPVSEEIPETSQPWWLFPYWNSVHKPVWCNANFTNLPHACYQGVSSALTHMNLAKLTVQSAFLYCVPSCALLSL